MAKMLFPLAAERHGLSTTQEHESRSSCRHSGDIRCTQYLQRAIQKYVRSAPRLSAWMEENLAEGFTVFDFPLEHRRFIRTTNSLERINREIRRRTRVVGIFPNEASCLRLISAILVEISEEWQIGKKFCISKSLELLNC